MLCTLVINQENIVLAIYYGLNSDDIFFLKDICNELEQPNDTLIVCVGILCFRKYKSIDLGRMKGGGDQCCHTKNRERLVCFIEINDLIDI